MTEKKPTFEDKLQELQNIVNKLESGDVPLDQALSQFKKGIKLSSELHSTLAHANKTLTKMMTDSGKEVPYDRDKNGKDVNETVGSKPKGSSEEYDPFK